MKQQILLLGNQILSSKPGVITLSKVNPIAKIINKAPNWIAHNVIPMYKQSLAIRGSSGFNA
jgi:hypothetical protein